MASETVSKADYDRYFAARNRNGELLQKYLQVEVGPVVEVPGIGPVAMSVFNPDDLTTEERTEYDANELVIQSTEEGISNASD